MTFKSKAPEGAILILNDGADREDLVISDRILEHIQRNAVNWYQSLNMYTMYPNGSMVVVTGCDKTKDWSNAAITNSFYDGSDGRTKLRYTRQPDYDLPWRNQKFIFSTQWYQPMPKRFTRIDIPADDPTKSQCVFVRTLRVSLGSICWANAMPVFPRIIPFVSFIIHKRILYQRLIDIIAVRLKLVYTEEVVRKMGNTLEVVSA